MGLLDDPNSNFAPMAAAVAGGAQAFTQAYGARQQQVHTMQNQDQELAMKKEYYNLQMQKLKQKVEPTSVDINNVMTKAYQYKALNELASSGKISQEDLNKQLTDYINGIETPGEANLAAKILSGGNKNVSPKEGQMITSLIGQGQVADRIAMQERTAGMKIKSAEQIAMEKRLQDVQEQSDRKDALLRAYGHDVNQLNEQSRHNKAIEATAAENAKANKLRAAKVGSKTSRDPYIDNLSRRLLNAENAVTKGKKKTDMLTNRADKIAAQEEYENNILLRDTLQKQFDDATGRGKKSAVPGQAPASSGVAPARQAAQGSFMGGMGPARIYELTEAKSAPDGALVRNNGVMYRKNAKTNKLEKVK